VIPHVVYATGPAIGRTSWEVLVEQNRAMLPSDTTFLYFTDSEMDDSFRNLSVILAAEGVVDDGCEGPPLFVNSVAFVNIARLHTHMPLACQWND
jgi:hypothetical protein